MSRQPRAGAGSGVTGTCLRRILCEVAHAAGPAIRGGTGRAVAATARKILRIEFALLRGGQPYRDPRVDH